MPMRGGNDIASVSPVPCLETSQYMTTMDTGKISVDPRPTGGVVINDSSSGNIPPPPPGGEMGKGTNSSLDKIPEGTSENVSSEGKISEGTSGDGSSDGKTSKDQMVNDSKDVNVSLHDEVNNDMLDQGLKSQSHLNIGKIFGPPPPPIIPTNNSNNVKLFGPPPPPIIPTNNSSSTENTKTIIDGVKNHISNLFGISGTNDLISQKGGNRKIIRNIGRGNIKI